MNALRTIPETANWLRVSTRTVYRLIAERKLKVTKVRGSTFVSDYEIDRYLRASERVG